MQVEQLNPLQWLAIDVTGQFGNGVDKQSFTKRIQWVRDNWESLEEYRSKAKKPIAFSKSVRALRKAARGEAVNHPIGLDASCSGLQLMSVVMRDVQGCKHTNAIASPSGPQDAYTAVTEAYNRRSGAEAKYDRARIKKAVMTSGYGSKAEPAKLFKTDENVHHFEQAMNEVVGGAEYLKNVLLSCWDSTALEHSWVMPDGHDVYIPTLITSTGVLEEESIGVPVVLHYKEVGTLEYRPALAANVVHSLDAYVLRCMVRRLTYNPKEVGTARDLLMVAAIASYIGTRTVDAPLEEYPELSEMLDLYKQTEMPDVKILGMLRQGNVNHLPMVLVDQLLDITHRMLSHTPVTMFTVHDDFRVHPKDALYVVDEYRNVLADLSDSNTLHFLLKQLGAEGTVRKLPKIGKLIRQAQYALS